MAFPTLNLTANAFDPLSEFQKGQEFVQGEMRKSYLRDIGPMLASGDMQGAAQSAFATGDPQMINTGMQLQNISMERGLKMANFFSEAAQRADTPEKWAKVIEAGRGIFGDKVSEYADFQTGRPNAMTALEQAQLDIQQQTNARQAAEFALRAPLWRAQAQEALASAEAKQLDTAEKRRFADMLYGSAVPSGVTARDATQAVEPSGLEGTLPQGQTPAAAPVAETRPLMERATPDQVRRLAAAHYTGQQKQVFDVLQEIITGKVDPKEMKDVTKLESDLRKEYTGLSKTFIEIRDAWARVDVSGQNPSAAGDLALIFSYMRLLDPASTVREGEFANAQNAAGVPDRVQNIWNQLRRGERLNPAQRTDFTTKAEALYKAQVAQHNQLTSQYELIAKAAGLEPSRVAIDLSRASAAPKEKLTPERRDYLIDKAREAARQGVPKAALMDRLEKEGVPRAFINKVWK